MGGYDFDFYKVAFNEPGFLFWCLRGLYVDDAVNVRGFGIAAAVSSVIAITVDEVNNGLDLRTDTLFQFVDGDFFCCFHESCQAFFAQFVWQLPGECVGLCPLDGGVGKAADAVDLGFTHEVEQVLEFGFGFSGESGNEGAADGEFRAGLAPLLDTFKLAFAVGRAFHAFEDVGVGMLQWDVQVRQDKALRHEGDDVFNVGVGVDVVQAYPGTVGLGEVAECFGEFKQAGFDGAAVPKTGAVFDVCAVCGGVLADDEEFFDSGVEEFVGFGEDVCDRAGFEGAAQVGDDAEGAGVVAAFADFEVCVVSGGEFDALWRYKVGEGVVGFGQVLVDDVHDFLQSVGTGDGEYAGVDVLDEVGAVGMGAGTQTAGDDDFAVFCKRFADGVQAFFDGVINEAAGVDDDKVGAGVAGRGGVAFGTELGEDDFGVCEGFGAAQGDPADAGRIGWCVGGCMGHMGEVGLWCYGSGGLSVA